MKDQGVWNNLAVLQLSDFGRTIASNGAGTDHAWGGNYFMVGGAVKGKQVLGSYPGKLSDEDNTLYAGRGGRLIPTTAWEQACGQVSVFSIFTTSYYSSTCYFLLVCHLLVYIYMLYVICIRY